VVVRRKERRFMWGWRVNVGRQLPSRSRPLSSELRDLTHAVAARPRRSFKYSRCTQYYWSRSILPTSPFSSVEYALLTSPSASEVLRKAVLACDARKKLEGKAQSTPSSKKYSVLGGGLAWPALGGPHASRFCSVERTRIGNFSLAQDESTSSRTLWLRIQWFFGGGQAKPPSIPNAALPASSQACWHEMIVPT
jgi:hypothetical protein